jgi:hypothetical protein
MESKMGAGVDYYAFKDRLMFSLDSFDFDRTPQPQFRLRARYAAFKYFHLLLGLNDFVIASNREVFFGLEFGF